MDDRYRMCSKLPNPRSDADINTYIMHNKEKEGPVGLEEALDFCDSNEVVVNETHR